MNLFIDSISIPASLVIFDDENNIVSQQTEDIALQESSKLIWCIDAFLKKNTLDYATLKNIVVVHGPGSFTWVRTTVLIANTIAFRQKIALSPLNYFNLFENFPIIKTSSKRDVFLKKDKQSEIEIVSNEDASNYLQSNSIKRLYGDFGKFSNWDIIQVQTPNYQDVIKNIELKNMTQIEPLYIKKPNIS